jgi:hypothetical protein
MDNEYELTDDMLRSMKSARIDKEHVRYQEKNITVTENRYKLFGFCR